MALSIKAGGQNGTPLPHEEPQELNPPAGVLAYYWLKTAANGPVKLELVDRRGIVAVCAASDTPVHPVDTEAINVQAIWQEPALPPSAQAGMHRFALNVAARGFGGGGGSGRGRAAPPAPRDACSPPPGTEAASTARPARGQGGGQREGPIALQPGEYTLRLTVNGQTYTQPATVHPDPRGSNVDHSNPGAAERY
jgi:hypothetical protein